MSLSLRTFLRGIEADWLRELLAGNVIANHSYSLEYRRDRSALLLVLFRLWFFLLAIASQLAFCHRALPSLAVGCGVLACPHTTAVHVQRSSGAVHDLLRDHDLLDALEAGYCARVCHAGTLELKRR